MDCEKPDRKLEIICSLLKEFFSEYDFDFFGDLFIDIDLIKNGEHISFSGNPAMRFYFNSRLELYDKKSLSKAEDFVEKYRKLIDNCISFEKKY